MGLHVHVVDEDLVDLAKLQHVLEHAVGLVGVDVDLEVGVGADDQLAVAEGGEVGERLVDVEVLLGLEEELVAVAELGALPVVVELDGDLGGDVGLGVDGGLEVGELAGLAGGGVDERLHEDGEAEGAGVHDAVLLEHGQQLGGARDRLVGLDDEGLQHVVRGEVAALLELVGPRRDVAQDGEDRALDRLADGLEGNPHAATEGMGDVGRGGVRLVLGVAEALGDAAQDLARDDAGVSSRAHERAVRDGL